MPSRESLCMVHLHGLSNEEKVEHAAVDVEVSQVQHPLSNDSLTQSSLDTITSEFNSMIKSNISDLKDHIFTEMKTYINDSVKNCFLQHNKDQAHLTISNRKRKLTQIEDNDPNATPLNKNQIQDGVTYSNVLRGGSTEISLVDEPPQK